MQRLVLVGLSLAALIALGMIQFSTPHAAATLLLATATRTPTPINVGNFVWDDIDHDGRQDAGEPGLAGVTVQLWNSAMNDLLDQAVTNANGSYTVTAPLPGNYRVRFLLPRSLDQFSPKDQAGGDDQKDSDVNPSGSAKGFTDVYVFGSNLISITSIDAGIIKFRTPTLTRTPTPINIGNFVWWDQNGNGQQDAGEPGLAGMTVQLWNSAKNNLIDTAVTSASGIYAVTAPLPGNYRVRVLLPSGGAQFSPKDQAGGDNLKDSDINVSGTNFGFTDVIAIASNVISITSVDAGIITAAPPPSPTPTRSRTLTPTATRTPTKTATSPPCNSKPNAPVLQAPVDMWQNQNRRVLLDWNDVSCADFYKVQVRVEFTNGVKADGAKVTESKYKTIQLARHKTYHWRVKACNPPYGCSKSPWRAFSIAE